jgi:hypothetical protein
VGVWCSEALLAPPEAPVSLADLSFEMISIYAEISFIQSSTRTALDRYTHSRDLCLSIRVVSIYAYRIYAYRSMHRSIDKHSDLKAPLHSSSMHSCFDLKSHNLIIVLSLYLSTRIKCYQSWYRAQIACEHTVVHCAGKILAGFPFYVCIWHTLGIWEYDDVCTVDILSVSESMSKSASSLYCIWFYLRISILIDLCLEI